MNIFAFERVLLIFQESVVVSQKDRRDAADITNKRPEISVLHLDLWSSVTQWHPLCSSFSTSRLLKREMLEELRCRQLPFMALREEKSRQARACSEGSSSSFHQVGFYYIFNSSPSSQSFLEPWPKSAGVINPGSKLSFPFFLWLYISKRGQMFSTCNMGCIYGAWEYLIPAIMSKGKPYPLTDMHITVFLSEIRLQGEASFHCTAQWEHFKSTHQPQWLPSVWLKRNKKSEASVLLYICKLV